MHRRHPLSVATRRPPIQSRGQACLGKNAFEGLDEPILTLACENTHGTLFSHWFALTRTGRANRL
jgi:hypothetical protein